MGPSGAGKSSLLNILSLKNLEYDGKVFYNGSDISYVSNYKDYISYIEQKDIFYPKLTVEEHMYIYGGLKLSHLSSDMQIERVQEVLKLLRISHTLKTSIVNLSGGEKKRLSIAEELLTEKEVIFLDEPTTGLDSYMADQVVEIIHLLAEKRQKTIIYTIHQPSYHMYQKFTNLMFLRNGKLFYFGLASQLESYLASISISLPKFANPSEVLLEILQNMKEDQYKMNEVVIIPEEVMQPTPYKIIEFGKASYLTQYYYLVYRTFIVRLRDRYATYLAVYLNLCLGLFLGSIFFQLEYKFSQISSLMGAIYILVQSPVFQSFFNCILTIVAFTEYTTREVKTKGLYSTSAWWVARTTGEVPIQLFMPLGVYMASFSALMGLFGLLDFLKLAGLAAFGVLTGSSMGYMVSTLSEQFDVVLTISIVVLVPTFASSPLLVNTNGIGWYISWTRYLSPFKLVGDMYYSYLFSGKTIACDAAVCNFSTGDELLSGLMQINQSFEEILFTNLINLVLIIIITRIIGWLRMMFIMDYNYDLNRVFNELKHTKITPVPQTDHITN